MKSPVRVLWAIKGLGLGGAEALLVAGASQHDQDRFQLTAAYVLPWKDDLAGALANSGVRVKCIGRGKRLGLGWLWRLRKLMYTVQLLMIRGGITLILSFPNAWFLSRISRSNFHC
ncbi:MAG: hypothetical protein MI740_18980, partial [Halanaerobiales bacterium]|nr:hypothetical protein [Halanaerobiales bacterium]